jgi:hypothetical protein
VVKRFGNEPGYCLEFVGHCRISISLGFRWLNQATNQEQEIPLATIKPSTRNLWNLVDLSQERREAARRSRGTWIKDIKT